MNKQQLASKIWASANKMRSKIEANEYKDYILGFIFYKFLSEKEVKHLKKNAWTDEYLPQLNEEDTDTVESVQSSIGYFISYDNLFSTWLAKGSDFSVQDVRDALSAFDRLISENYKHVYAGIFDTLQTGLSKLGDSAASQSKAISELIQLIKDIPMDGKQGYDVLGFIYEYLISMFAANAGKKAGEFYTPHEVSQLMAEIVANHLKDRDTIKVYDPTSGSGSLLITIGKSVSKYLGGKNSVMYYAQELKQNTYNLTRMNLVMRDIDPSDIKVRNADTLEDDWPYFEDSDPVGTYELMRVDAVVSNPPYSQVWDSANKENDPRYSNYGVAPKSKADYAFLLHDLYHVLSDGIMTIVLPHGVLFRGGEEGKIRQALIEKHQIDTIIGLPANIFFGTGIPTIIMVLRPQRENTDVLIIDASKGFEKEGKNNKLRACDIRRIADTVKERKSIDKFSRVVSIDEIRANDYNLNIPRYVDSSEPTESWDIYATMFGGIPQTELNALKDYWEAFPSLKSTLFNNPDSAYCSLAVSNVKEAVSENVDVVSFKQRYAAAFHNFKDYLESHLIADMEGINISTAEDILAHDIFSRLSGIPLVDKYDAYQLLDNEWSKIAVDIETIQADGKEAITAVDPHLIIKKIKRNGKEVEDEVQDGWVGRIIPFNLVQSTVLKEQKDAIKENEARLTDIASEYGELFDSLTEDEKQYEFAGEDSFVIAEVKKAAKSKGIEPDTKEKLRRVLALNDEERSLKAATKKGTAALEDASKTAIESLSDEQAEDLLVRKWISPLVSNVNQLPEDMLSTLISRVCSLASKYSTTFENTETQILNAESSLCSMIDDLTGNDFDMSGLKEFKKLLGGN